jgi:hypothetical protein
MGAQLSISNRALPIIINRAFAIIERGRITAFLRNPCRQNLPPQIKTNVLRNQGGRVFLCDAPDGRRIFLKTSFKRRVIISLRYQDGNIFAELRPFQSPAKTSEVFLVKEGDKIYHEGKKVDSKTKGKLRRIYQSPKIVLKTKSDKIKRGHQIESWLRGSQDIPKTYITKISGKGLIQLCPHLGSPVILNLGIKFAGRKVRISFEETDEAKRVRIRTKSLEWLFELTATDFKCAIREISAPGHDPWGGRR